MFFLKYIEIPQQLSFPVGNEMSLNLRLYCMIFFTQQKRSKFQKYALLAHESPKLVGLRASSVSPIHHPSSSLSPVFSQRLLGSLPPGGPRSQQVSSLPPGCSSQRNFCLCILLKNLPSSHHRPGMQDTGARFQRRRRPRTRMHPQAGIC